MAKALEFLLKVRAFARAHGARIFAAWVALAALLGDYGVVIPESASGAVVALLALLAGEAVQRVENRKTQEAKAEQPDA